MAGNALDGPEQSTSPVETGQEDGPVQVNLKRSSMSREIRVALFSFGWDSIGTGARLVLLAFARSPEIRAAVRKQLGMMAPEER